MGIFLAALSQPPSDTLNPREMRRDRATCVSSAEPSALQEPRVPQVKGAFSASKVKMKRGFLVWVMLVEKWGIWGSLW